jgi:ubiquinone/menaquinone biosynthesis C-methylase UbiE
MAIAKSLYNQHTDQYEALIGHEDYQHCLLPEIERLHPLNNCQAAEFGAGTGRITRQLAPHVRSIHAFDLSQAMLQTGKCHRSNNTLSAVADNRALPIQSHSVDLTIEGWSLAQMVAWERDEWTMVVERVVAEMRRVLRSDGTMILIETLGTGAVEPHPPSDWMADLYSTFETVYGFTRTVIRTDFFFDSPEQAYNLMAFFWGEEHVNRIIREALIPQGNGVVVPECTGIWWRRACAL